MKKFLIKTGFTVLLSSHISLVYASSAGSTLCIVSQYNTPITISQVSIDPSQWENNNRLVQEYFQGKTLNFGDSLCTHLEANKSYNPFVPNKAIVNMVIQSDNANIFNFTWDQYSASTTSSQNISPSFQQNARDSIFQTSVNGNPDNNTDDILTFYIRSSKPDNSNWMRDLTNIYPNLNINQIVVPSSHDSGVNSGNGTTIDAVNNSWFVTNSLNIYDQLVAGVRFFDMRVGLKDGILRLYHPGPDGINGYGETLLQALQHINDFIKNTGTQETIFLYFSHTDASVDKSTMVNFIKNSLNNNLYIGESSSDLAHIQLSRLQGKVIPILDQDDLGAYVNPEQGAWGFINYPALNNGYLSVYNQYSNTVNPNFLITDQNSKLSQFGGLNKNNLFLLGYTLTGQVGSLDIQAMSSMMNPRISTQLTNFYGNVTKPNIISYDFIDPWLTKEIINVNYHQN